MASVYKKSDKGNYFVSWFDHTGKRREKSTRTTDRRAADQLGRKLETDAMLRREEIIDVRADRFATENRKPLREHMDAYIKHCERAGQADKNIVEKRRHLARLLDETGASRLSDLTPDLLEGNMAAMTVQRRVGVDPETEVPIYEYEPASARTKNFRRQVAVAFLNWAAKTGTYRVQPVEGRLQARRAARSAARASALDRRRTRPIDLGRP
jgi:hypothetical protein